MNTDYYHKYLKYKSKYLALRGGMVGGGGQTTINDFSPPIKVGDTVTFIENDVTKTGTVISVNNPFILHTEHGMPYIRNLKILSGGPTEPTETELQAIHDLKIKKTTNKGTREEYYELTRQYSNLVKTDRRGNTSGTIIGNPYSGITTEHERLARSAYQTAGYGGFSVAVPYMIDALIAYYNNK